MQDPDTSHNRGAAASPHIFGGEPDQRQSSDRKMPVSRFRPRYRALSDEEKALHDEIKDRAAGLEDCYARIGILKRGATGGPQPTSRYHSLAITALEESVMWSVKDLTS